MAVEISEDGSEIKFDRWCNTGGMLSVNRDCLNPDDPDQTWNYLRANGIDNPADYGITDPRETLYGNMSRNDLIDEVIRLEKEILGMSQWL
ncbi:hypothetical protein N9937_00835 [bacterium]|nr:hypothetical protein [bacterium]